MSENINGGLAFKATLDINDFNVSSNAMERRIITMSDTAVQESARMEQSIMSFAQNGARYIVSYLVGNGMMSLANSIVQTRGQFQQLEIAFETMLGSGSKAKSLMDQMTDTAAKTPFDLAGVAGGAKQLLAYGESADKVNDTLVRLGNIASGLSIPLNDIVYLYGTTMVQGRLYAQDVRQFTGRGIPLVKELAAMYGKTAEEINAMVSEGKIGFPEVEKVINKLTNSGGQFFNLMEKQSASLTGMIANLGDAWDMALNKLGEDNQDVFATGIDGATYLVEHLDDILRIVKAITIAYGSYKAAIVLNTLATKGYTGIALLDNTARQAKIALMKAEEAISGKNISTTNAMKAAQEAHTAALLKQLTVEEQNNLSKQLRIATIHQLLTAQQQEYLSNLGLTTSSQNYEAVAMSVLSVEQRMALSKTDLSSKSAIYRAALEQEVAKKQSAIASEKQANAAKLESMRTDVKAAAARVESAKSDYVIAKQRVENARYELYWAKLSEKGTKIVNAEKKLEAAIENQTLVRRTALNAQSALYSKRKELEAFATKKSTVASIADTAAKGGQAAATSLLTALTTKCTAAWHSLKAAFLSNPIGWIVTLLGMAASALFLFSSREDEATEAMGEFQNSTQKEIDNLKVLMAILRNTEIGTTTHKQAIDKINSILQEYNKELLKENEILDEQSEKYKDLTAAILANTAAKVKAKYTEQATQKQNKDDDKTLSDFKEQAKKLKAYNAIPGAQGYYASAKNINEMGDNVFDLIYADAKEMADKLYNLTGHEYTVKFNESMDDVATKVQRVTGASDAEMNAFKGVFKTTFTEIIEHAKKFHKDTDEIVKTSDLYNGKNEVKVNTDYASQSFSELDKLAKDTQTEIDTLQKKAKDGIAVETDNTRLVELLGILGQVKTAISTKESDLNTESGINTRIKELQEERAGVILNGKEYEDLTKRINRLQKKLPDNSKNAGENALKKQEQLAERQKQADLNLEKARIEIMEDGYAKRKAMLDLQHKQNLLEIDKEEKELTKARKDAGKGELSDKEKKTFSDRRDVENQSYDKSQNKLFDGELEYKKSQYALYFRWVENMGKKAADEQFAELLKSGNSYKEWIEREIEILESKKNSGTDLSQGEGNYLISLRGQQDEMNGEKSSMDKFKEEIALSIDMASTLAEKMQAIADAKEKLANGKTGLLGEDQKAEANLHISNLEADVNKELQTKVLTDFKTFEEKKKQITDEYALLRNQAMIQNNAELLAEVNKGETEALSALNAQMLMQTESWNNLFSDLDSLTVEQIDKLITEIQQKMNTADLKMNPADMKAILDRLDEAKQKIIDVNPFKSLGNAIKAVFGTAEQKSKHSSGSIKDDWKKLADATEGVFDFVNNAIDGCDVLSDLIGDSGKATIQMLQGVTMAGIAMAASIKTAEKGSVVLAAISIALQAIQWIATLFNDDEKIEKKIQSIQKNIDALENSFDRLQHAMDQTYWVYSDQEKAAHEQRVQAINDEIRALEQQAVVAKQSWNFVKYAELSKQIKDLKYALEKEETKGDIFQLYELQTKNLKEQQVLIKQQIEAEKGKKDTDWDKIAQWEEAIKDIDTQLEDMGHEMMEALAGTDIKSAIDEFADAMVDAYLQGENAADALGKKTKDVLKNAVVEALKRNYLAKGIEEAVKYLGSEDVWKDNMLDEREQAEFERLVNLAGDNFNKYLGALDGFIDKTENTPEDPLTGAVRSLSEETGGVIAGRLNAFIINQSDQTTLLRQSLIYQQETANNTGISASELKEIKDTLKRIENKDSSLLSQGIS